ncbi:MAG TPA: hypothetical protein PKD24_11955 [Pyrinomonadaceae bacterium]|nr:hypothetical protein [Pyrinomonadaceae bacterium]HMP65962.1 hypothetical protein [Pyrinomonadaceae bacterium]
MKIARYWKRADIRIDSKDGRPMDVVAWGWSADTPDEAQKKADEAVQRSARRIASGEGFPDSYGYPDRPAREEIIEEIKDESGETIAMITRNSYGSLVLNTSRLMFIDIDVPKPASQGLIGLIKSLFGSSPSDPFESALIRIREKAATLPDLTFRVYRTAAGFRLAVINKRIDPTGSESQSLLSAFGSDPLYVRLCKNQESFRARLTPKHWRCRVESPRGRYPFRDQVEEDMHRLWIENYNAATAGYAVCRFVEQIGSQPTFSDFRRLIELHDRETKATSSTDALLA